MSAPQILNRTGLKMQAHELIAGFPHSISTGNKAHVLIGENLGYDSFLY